MSTPNFDSRYAKPADVTAAITAQATTDAGQYATKASPAFTGSPTVGGITIPQLAGYYIPEQFGAVGDGTTDDTTALNSFFQYCSTNGKVAKVPAKTYLVTGTITATTTGHYAMIEGIPGAKIKSTSSTANILVLGNGVTTKPDLVNGYVRDLIIQGPTATPAQNGQVAFLLDNLTQMRIENVSVSNTDIGFDFIDNCYGAHFMNCRTGFFSSCNVGLNLRSTPTAGSGNQCYFYNCWLEGKYAAVHMSPNTDGFAFYGGQMVASRAQSGSQDAFGAVIYGKDYLAGTTGSMGNFSLYDVDFEQCGGWILRGYGQATGVITGCPMLSNGSVATIGVMKSANAGNPSFTFTNNRLIGAFSSATAFVLGDYGAGMYEEGGWNADGYTFNGVTPTNASMLQQSGVTKGISKFRPKTSGPTVLALDGLQLRKSGSYLQTSPDGTTWSTLTPVTAVPLVDPTATTGLILDLDPVKISGLSDGSAISSWTDSSSAANNAVQATGTLQPLYRTAWSTNLLPNSGHPVVVFDGTDDYLSSPATSSGAQTIFFVASANNFPSVAYLMGSFGGTGGLALRIQGTGTQLFSEADAVATIATSQTIAPGKNAHHVYALSYDGTSAWVLSFDGVETSGTTANAVTASRTSKIGGNAAGNGMWNGAMARVMKFNTALTAANRQGIVAWLMKRYNIG